MHIILQPVEVRLVGAWWEQIIPIAALLISLFSIGLSLWFRYSDRLRLHVGIGESFPLGPNGGLVEGAERLTVEVTNRSRTASTQVKSLVIELPSGSSFGLMQNWEYDDTLPVVLGPGESAQVSYLKRDLGAALLKGGLEPEWVRARATCGHGPVRGKRRSDLPEQLREYATQHEPPYGY